MSQVSDHIAQCTYALIHFAVALPLISACQALAQQVGVMFLPEAAGICKYL